MIRLASAFFVVVAIVSAFSSAAAQDTKKGKFDVDAIFNKLDTNNDGKLQRDEFLKMADSFKNRDKAREKLGNTFTTIDTERRGYLSRDQFRVYLETAKKKD